LDIYWNILTMHGPINVKSPNNTIKWQMGFNSSFKGLRGGRRTAHRSSADACSESYAVCACMPRLSNRRHVTTYSHIFCITFSEKLPF